MDKVKTKVLLDDDQYRVVYILKGRALVGVLTRATLIVEALGYSNISFHYELTKKGKHRMFLLVS